jgi:hypothetical protein
MPKTPSPLHAKRVPKSVSAPAGTAEAAAALAESVEAPAPRKTRTAATKTKAPVATKAAQAVDAPSAPVEKPSKPAKAIKQKLVRDSFTIPKNEYQVLDALKQRALGLEQPVRKSEMLRAGIAALGAMNDRAFLKALAAVPTLKTGRPKAD